MTNTTSVTFRQDELLHSKSLSNQVCISTKLIVRTGMGKEERYTTFQSHSTPPVRAANSAIGSISSYAIAVSFSLTAYKRLIVSITAERRQCQPYLAEVRLVDAQLSVQDAQLVALGLCREDDLLQRCRVEVLRWRRIAECHDRCTRVVGWRRGERCIDLFSFNLAEPRVSNQTNGSRCPLTMPRIRRVAS